MSLPSITLPTYRVTLPISGARKTVRPFLMKEEKVLMVAFESGETEQILDAMAKVIQDCVEEPIDLNNLSLIDTEYLLIKLKSFSRGETIDVTMRCNNPIKDESGEMRPCGCHTDLSISLEDIDDHINTDQIIDNKIKLTDNIGITCRPPRFKCMGALMDPTLTVAERNLIILADSIEAIWNNDEVFPTATESVEAVINFIEEMDAGQFKRFRAYFESLPEIKMQEDFKCPSCGNDEKVNIRNIQNFFV